jgi:hypothetical protein
MKQAGRVNLLVIFAVLALILVAGLALLSGASATGAAADFLAALQKQDVDALTELCNVPEGEKAKLRKDWEFTTKSATPYYNFAWSIKYAKRISDNEAAVAVKVIKNADASGSFDENFELPMVKVAGKWKVDIYRLSRNLYPALPRMGKSFE